MKFGSPFAFLGLVQSLVLCVAGLKHHSSLPTCVGSKVQIDGVARFACDYVQSQEVCVKSYSDCGGGATATFQCGWAGAQCVHEAFCEAPTYTPVLRITFENSELTGAKGDILPAGATMSPEDSISQTSASKVGGNAGDFLGTTTGLAILGYGGWFQKTSTFACWFWAQTSASKMHLLFRSSGSGTTGRSWGMLVKMQDGNFWYEFSARDASGFVQKATSELFALSKIDQQWVHLAVVVYTSDSSAPLPRLYEDGQEVTMTSMTHQYQWTMTTETWDSTQYLDIARHPKRTNKYFDGYIDQFEVYEEELGPDVIKSMAAIRSSFAECRESD